MKDRKEIQPYMAYKPTQIYNVLKDLSRKQGYKLSAETYENPGNPENKINYYLKMTIIISLLHLMMLKKVVRLQQLQPH